MHPPQELIAGVYPGKGRHYNSIKHRDYYRFLIPDPAVPGHLVVAPFINFHMHPSKP
jgi:diadenosine tetraphosphate (Ap4A) HIT family hydrolase